MTDFLATLSGLTTTTVLIALIIASSLLVIMTDWRVLNLVLGIQYLLIGVFLIVSRIEGFPAELAIVKALVGVMIVPVLYISSRRVRWGQRDADRLSLQSDDDDEDEEEDDAESAARRLTWLRAPGLALRVLIVVFGATVALSLALRYPIQFTAAQTVSRDITIATFILLTLGLLNMLLNENPLKTGLGLLTIMAGFEMFYTLVEPALVVVALLGLVNLVVALALSYLVTAWATSQREVSG
jgi:hypothetical protein